ncbi:hypothetical protein HYU40_03685 [Candidatus Woesearchaeota archaeon]|nr:hypothetical protein [Candidatus Woesearchaeota archaeon]
MKKERKGQAAFEYILVAAVIGIMILPAAYLFFRYSHSTADQIDKAQLDQLGRNIVAAAERIYFQGPPSRTELEARMPKNVLNVSVIGSWNTGMQELVMIAGGANGVAEFPYPSKVNINGSFNGSLHELAVGAGIKKVSIEAYETQPDSSGGATSFVNINFGGRCPVSTVIDYNGDGSVDGQDWTFFNRCFCDSPGYPKFRPSKTWKSGWFDNSGAFGQSSQYLACVNLDYNGDCVVDQDDADLACSTLGALCGAASCPPP